MGRPNLTGETKLSDTNGDRKNQFSCSANRKQDWVPYPVDAQSAESDDRTHKQCRTAFVLRTVPRCFEFLPCP